MTYNYPQIDRVQGYAFNMLERIEQTVGIRPTGSGDSGDSTYLDFERELTAQEKATLDSLMADNPTLPPTKEGSKFVIRDVWNQKAAIEEAMGFPYRVYYTQSTPGGPVDQVELHFDQVLTVQESDKVIEEYGKLIELK